MSAVLRPSPGSERSVYALWDALQRPRRTSADPIPSRVLAHRLEINDRTLRDFVHEARLMGYPVLSGDRGFYLPSDAAEARACAARMESHALGELAVVSALRRWAADREAEDAYSPTLFDARREGAR